MCHDVHLCVRHNRLKGTPSDVAPILWQNGALARLKKGETIDKLLYGGYSTISLGYAGLCECTRYMTGKSRIQIRKQQPFALEVMQHMNDSLCEVEQKRVILISVFTERHLNLQRISFARCLQERFGIIPGVTDKNYITNSYHIHVTEEIDAFDKLKL